MKILYNVHGHDDIVNFIPGNISKESIPKNIFCNIIIGFNNRWYAQSPIHGVTVGTQTEHVIEKQLNEGEDVHHVDEVVSEVVSGWLWVARQFNTLVKYGQPVPDEATPIHPGRTRQPGKHARSPFIPLYSSGGSSSIGPKFFYLKHPFTTLISENVDFDMLDKFNKWLYHWIDEVSKRKKAPFSIKEGLVLFPCSPRGSPQWLAHWCYYVLQSLVQVKYCTNLWQVYKFSARKKVFGY